MHSNTTLVKVKLEDMYYQNHTSTNSNTTLVKVKFYDDYGTIKLNNIFKYNSC